MSEFGHGHVIPRPDGVKARCGGPALCALCAKELAAVTALKPLMDKFRKAQPAKRDKRNAP